MSHASTHTASTHASPLGGARTAVHAGDAVRIRLATLVLRVALGVVFLAHAGLKWFDFTLPGTAEFFVAHGLPGWSAYAVFAAELLGGTALVLGVGTRWVALGLAPVMLGALTVHWPNGWSFTAPDGGWEYVAFLLAALVAQAGLGDGAFALGARLRLAGSAPERGRAAPAPSAGTRGGDRAPG